MSGEEVIPWGGKGVLFPTFPQPTRSLRERSELTSEVRDRAPAENGFQFFSMCHKIPLVVTFQTFLTVCVNRIGLPLNTPLAEVSYSHTDANMRIKKTHIIFFICAMELFNSTCRNCNM